jgi:hypothetical protein
MSTVQERADQLIVDLGEVGAPYDAETIILLLAETKRLETENAELKAKEIDLTVVYMSGVADGKSSARVSFQEEIAEKDRSWRMENSRANAAEVTIINQREHLKAMANAYQRTRCYNADCGCMDCALSRTILRE